MGRKLLIRIGRFLQSDEGATAVEYAVILMLILLGLITAVQSVGSVAENSLQNSADEINNAFKKQVRMTPTAYKKLQ